jgi:hypothetical protein
VPRPWVAGGPKGQSDTWRFSRGVTRDPSRVRVTQFVIANHGCDKINLCNLERVCMNKN